jgi:hypothetical protein
MLTRYDSRGPPAISVRWPHSHGRDLSRTSASVAIPIAATTAIAATASTATRANRIRHRVLEFGCVRMPAEAGTVLSQNAHNGHPRTSAIEQRQAQAGGVQAELAQQPLPFLAVRGTFVAQHTVQPGQYARDLQRPPQPAPAGQRLP